VRVRATKYQDTRDRAEGRCTHVKFIIRCSKQHARFTSPSFAFKKRPGRRANKARSPTNLSPRRRSAFPCARTWCLSGKDATRLRRRDAMPGLRFNSSVWVPLQQLSRQVAANNAHQKKTSLPRRAHDDKFGPLWRLGVINDP